MANLAPLIPLLFDILSKDKKGSKVADLSGQLQRDADTVSAVDQRQDIEIQDLVAAVRELRRAIVALTGQFKRLGDRVTDLEDRWEDPDLEEND